MLPFHQPYLYHKLPERQPTCTFIVTNTPTQVSAFVNLLRGCGAVFGFSLLQGSKSHDVDTDSNSYEEQNYSN